MTLTFTHTGPSITQQEIDQKAQDLGIVLPKDYQQFLLKYNGGEPEPCYFRIKDRQKQNLPFYNLRDIAEFYTLQQIYISEDNTPKEFVVIGESPLYNTIVLGHSGPYTNQVFYWDYEDSVDYDEDGNLPLPTMDNMYWIADNFSEFLDLLIEDPDEPKETDLNRLFRECDIQGLKQYYGSSSYDPMALPDRGQADVYQIISETDSVELLKILASKGVNLIQEQGNWCYWYSAAKCNRVGMLKYFLEQGSTMGKSFKGLYEAVLEGSFEAVLFILSLGADPTEGIFDDTSSEDKTLLRRVNSRINHPSSSDKREELKKIYALLEPYFFEKFKQRFENPTYDPMMLPDKGQADLLRITRVLGSVQLVSVLVSKGVNPLQNQENWLIAAKYNRVDLLEYFIEKGSSMGTSFGGLREAALEGSLEAVEYILSLGADPTREFVDEFYGEDKSLLGVVDFYMRHPPHPAKREALQKIHDLLEPYFKGKS